MNTREILIRLLAIYNAGSGNVGMTITDEEWGDLIREDDGFKINFGAGGMATLGLRKERRKLFFRTGCSNNSIPKKFRSEARSIWKEVMG